MTYGMVTALQRNDTHSPFPSIAWLVASLGGGVLGSIVMSPFASTMLLHVPAVSGVAIVLMQWLVVRGRVAYPRMALANLFSMSITGWVLGAIIAILGTTLLRILNMLAVGQSEPAALLRGAIFAAFAGAVMGLTIGRGQEQILHVPQQYRIVWLLTSSMTWAMGVGLYGAAISVWVMDGPVWRSVMAHLSIADFGAHLMHWVGFLGLLGALSGSVIGVSTGIALTWLIKAKQHRQQPSND